MIDKNIWVVFDPAVPQQIQARRLCLFGLAIPEPENE